MPSVAIPSNPPHISVERCDLEHWKHLWPHGTAPWEQAVGAAPGTREKKHRALVPPQCTAAHSTSLPLHRHGLQGLGKPRCLVRQILLYCFEGKKVNSFHCISLGGKSTLQVRCYVTLTHHVEITLFPYVSFAFIFAFLCAPFCEN